MTSATERCISEPLRGFIRHQSNHAYIDGGQARRWLIEIADKLDAALGGGECVWTLKEKWPNRTGDDHIYGYETGCGARHTWWPDSLPKFCPTCGGKVKAVKR